MFEDFSKAEETKEGRGRRAISLTVSALIFALIIGGLAAAIATARAVVHTERSIDIEFSDIPLPEIETPRPEPVEPASPPPQATKRRRARTVTNRPPTDVPDERPEEAEGELVEATDTGPIDGFTDGGGDDSANGPPLPEFEPEPDPVPSPQQRSEMVSRPRFMSGCRAPPIPEALHSQAATIHIEIRMLIDERGNVASARILESHPLVPDELVLACAREQVFEPAHLPDGTRVPYPFRRRFVFRPDRA